MTLNVVAGAGQAGLSISQTADTPDTTMSGVYRGWSDKEQQFSVQNSISELCLSNF